MDRTVKIVSSLFVASLAAACATVEGPPPARHAVLEAAPVADWSQAKADRLAIGENDVDISARAPAYTFDTGKSFYRLVQLPASPRPLEVRFAAIYLRSDPGFFQPDILVLDRNRKVVRTIDAPLKGRQAVQLPPFRYVLPGRFELAEGEYLLIRTTEDLMRTRVPIEGAPFIPNSGAVTTIPAQVTIPSTPTGKLWIDLAARSP